MSPRTRRYLVVAAAVLIAYPLASWIIGFIVEVQVQAALQASTQQAGPYASMVEKSYQRGVFGASELMSVGIDKKSFKSPGPLAGFPGLGNWQLTVRNTIHHGPFPGGRTFALATIDSELVLSPEVQKRLQALFPGKQPYKMRTTLGWLGSRRSEISSPAFSGEIAPHTTISSGGITGTATASRDLRATTFDLTVKNLGVSTAKFQAQLDDLRIESKLQRVFGTLNIGDIAFSIGRVDAHNNSDADKRFAVQQVEITSHSSATGDYLSLNGKLATGPLQAGKFSATQAVYEFNGTHFYGPSFANLVDSARTVGNTVSTQAAQKLLATLRTDGIDLLLHDPVIEVPHLDYVTAEGAFTLSARVAAPGLKREDLEGGRPALVAALAQHLQARADIRVDTSLLDKLTEGTPGNGDRLATAVRQLEGQGYIAHEGNSLVAHLTFDHGQLRINAKPFPPSGGGPRQQ